MKKVFLLIALVAGLSISCESDMTEGNELNLGENQDKVTIILDDFSQTGRDGIWCIEFDELQIRRPKKNCESGFWICCDGEKCTNDCADDEQQPIATLNGRLATVKLDFSNANHFELRFPVGLKSLEGRTAKEFDFFEGLSQLRVFILHLFFRYVSLLEGKGSFVKLKRSIITI